VRSNRVHEELEHSGEKSTGPAARQFWQSSYGDLRRLRLVEAQHGMAAGSVDGSVNMRIGRWVYRARSGGRGVLGAESVRIACRPHALGLTLAQR
jgi:hypothetical protein